MEYNSTITKNEIRSSAATWMGLDFIILIKDSQRKINSI